MNTKTLPITTTAENSLECSALDSRSKELRKTIIHILEASRRGHVGSAFSVLEILRVLYDDVMLYDSRNPRFLKRDRCILSKGHGCLALYVILADKAFFPESELWKFCKPDGILGGHPEYGKIPGVEASTGSLGHGLPIGVGFALNAKYEKLDYRTFVIIGDGESDEGSNWEAAMSAAKHKLDNLTVLVDYNKHQSYDSTYAVLDLEPLVDKWRAFGFSVAEVDGHDVGALQDVLRRTPFSPDKPNAIICHTVKGKGVECIENDLNWHHKSKVSDNEIVTLLNGLEMY
ncbi:MAG: transketolase [Pseudomonadota bacterium]